MITTRPATRWVAAGLVAGAMLLTAACNDSEPASSETTSTTSTTTQSSTTAPGPTTTDPSPSAPSVVVPSEGPGVSGGTAAEPEYVPESAPTVEQAPAQPQPAQPAPEAPSLPDPGFEPRPGY